MINLGGNTRGRVKIVGISGSIRSGSFNTGLLRAAQELAPESLEIRLFDLIDVPLYNGDIEAAGDPAAVAMLKAAIRDADGVLIATPEYNHGPSGVIKNAIDWASRDHGDGSLMGKAVTMIGTGGSTGTAGAQQQLEIILSATGALVMVKPGVFVSMAWEKFDADGRLVDQQSRAVLRSHLEAFLNWIDMLTARRAALAA